MKDVSGFGWPTTQLGDLVDILDRLRKPITQSDRKAGPYPYYGATGVLDFVEGYLFDEPLVLIGEDGAKWEAGANSAFPIEGKAWVNNHAHVIRPHRGRVLDAWLIYYLNGSDLMPFVSGMTVPKLNQGRLREIPIPLPPLEEQKQIVAVLDEAFEGLARARAHAEANLGDARELFSEVVTRCFLKAGVGATETTLGSLAEFRNGLNYTRTSKGKSVKIVGVGDFKDHFTVPVETLSEIVVDGDLASEDRLRPGDLLAVRSNGNRELIGRTMLVPDLTNAVSFSGFTIRIRLLSAKLLPEYLCEFMRTKAARRMLIDGGGGSNISNLNQKLLSSLPIAFPSITDQRSILEELDGIRAKAGDLVGMYETKIRQVDALRQSLLQKAFAGELT